LALIELVSIFESYAIKTGGWS